MFEEPPSGLHQPLMQARQGPLEANSPNPMPMFCVYCHAIGTKESFSKRLPPWSWRFWRIKLIPLIIATAVSLVLPFQTTARLIIGTLLYSFPVLHQPGAVRMGTESSRITCGSTCLLYTSDAA